MTPFAPPFIVRLCARLIPPRYRGEVLADLLDECAASVRPRRGRLYAALWLLAHVLRSAVAVRRHARRGVPPRRRDVALAADELAADWRFARRSLARSPLFTAVALLILTVAIGLSTAVFSLVSSVLIRPLPYRDPDRLVRLAQFRPGATTPPPVAGGLLAAVTVGAWTAETEALDAIVPYSANGTTRVAFGGTIEQLVVARVGDRFFEVLGVQPSEGRLLHQADGRTDAPPVAVVSRRLWHAMAGRGEEAGDLIVIEGVPHDVVGAAPAGFEFPSPAIDVWVPGRWSFPAPGGRASFSHQLEVIARMRPLARIEDVQQEGERVLRSIAMADPAFFDGDGAVPRLRVTRLRDHVVGDTRPALQALFAGMALVLVTACASLANLLVARNSARERDLTIRMTLGATRRRLIRPLVLEHAVLTGAGAALGALAGRWIVDALPAIAPSHLPRLSEVRFDWVAFAAVTALTLSTALVATLRPAWRRPGGNLRELAGSNRLQGASGSRSAEMLRGALVAAQVALAVVLLVGAALIGRSLWNLLSTSPGYEPEGVLTFQVGLPANAWEERGRQTRFYDRLLARIQGLDAVTAAAVASRMPLHSGGMSGTFFIEGQPRPADPADSPRAHHVMVSPGYFGALGTRVLAGRAFDERDRQETMPVVLVDELLARRYFGGEALGRRVRSIGGKIWTIAGIVETVKLGAVSAADEPIIYFPYTQVGEMLTFSRLSAGVLVRTRSDPMALAPAIRQFAKELEPSAALFNVMPLGDRLDRTFDQPRFYTLALVLFAAMTVATAALGVYGVQAYAVERRTAEFGVRRALGATERDIAGLVLKRAVLLAAVGTAVGIPLAASGAGLMQALLFGVRPLDPLTLVAVPVAVLLLVLGASWQPARRALRVDPAHALRVE